MSTVSEIEGAIVKLSLDEQRELARWLGDRLVDDETPELLAELDVGICSLEKNGARVFTRDELEQKVRKWSGA